MKQKGGLLLPYKDKKKANGKTKDTLTEMDDEYHNKFRTPKTKESIQKDN